MAYRTTPADLAYFQTRVYAWARKIGLTDWSILVETGVKNTGVDAASIHYKDRNRIATIGLAEEYAARPSRAQLDRHAFHEVAHLLLADLAMLADRKDGTTETVDQAEHVIIRRLESLLFGLERAH